MSKTCASTTASTAATAPTSTARRTACGIPARSDVSRTGTWVPTTNMTRAKPMLASRVNVGSVVSMMSKPVLPMTIPAVSSPMMTGMANRGTVVSSGPTMPITTSSASVPNPNPDTIGSP